VEVAMSDGPDSSDVDQRLARIERQLGLDAEARGTEFHPAWPFAAGTAAVCLGYLGVGTPRHYYQVLFSILLLLLLYHRGSLLPAQGVWKWPLICLNFLLFCLLFQLLIGGGVTHPFDWVRVPVITKALPPADLSWYAAVVPDYSVQWQAVSKLAEWSIDVTKVQAFLFLAVMAGALFRFEPFTSLTALALLLISLPVYLRFNWDWVVPFIIAGSVALYLQTAGPARQPRQ
jgi:hypothetical protein